MQISYHIFYLLLRGRIFYNFKKIFFDGMLKNMTTKEEFKPHIPAERNTKEFTIRAAVLGLFLGFIFAIGNAYLALKIGTTISASIPAAILSMAILRTFFRKVSILENNIVQAIASVGEGMAAGVVFTIPALILLGDHPSIWRVFWLAALGGVLGILFMIPMRRYIIVQEHGILPFPEGTACAEILKAGESSKGSAMMAAWGVIIGVVYKLCSNAFYFWNEVASWKIKPYHDTVVSVDATPALLGVGYIIGARISALVFAGGALAWWVIIPLIRMFGMGDVMIFPSSTVISHMSSEEIWSNYVRYIGAGAVAIGGMISLVKIFPLIIKTVHVGVKELFGGFKLAESKIRTDRDISLAWLTLGSLASILFLWLVPIFYLNFFTIILLVVLGFFFVAVTSITVGLVGSTSNPVSGMTITILLVTSILFVLLGWTSSLYIIAAITMSCVANVAVCLAGTTSQDLKTGFLLGATPKRQQVAEIIGAIIPALALGSTIYVLNQAYHIGSEVMPAPQATLMSMIAKGVIMGELPYTLVIAGVVLGLLVYIMRIPVLPFAIGLYLPLSLSTGMMAGGIVSWFVNRHTHSEASKQNGILISSGFVGGDACTGIIIALLVIFKVIPASARPYLPDYVSLIAFVLLGVFLAIFTLKRSKSSHSH